MSMTEERLLCSYCGRPPHREGDTMLRCSRCKQAWYHDTVCQKRHYKLHRPLCLHESTVVKNKNRNDYGTNSDSASETSPDQYRQTAVWKEALVYLCETQTSRGRCMVAKENIQKGSRILAPPWPISMESTRPSVTFRPLVPPVLYESQRDHRCSVCFVTISSVSTAPFTFISSPQKHRRYLQHKFCSLSCRTVGRDLGLQEEEYIVDTFSEKERKMLVRVSPTALLLFRIVRQILFETLAQPEKNKQVENSSTYQEISILTFHADQTSTEENLFRNHITSVVLELVMLSPSLQDAHMIKCEAIIQPMQLNMIVARIIQNGFTITDGFNHAIGLGIFPHASIINHSCVPNLVQTFTVGCQEREILDPQQLQPGLILTASQDIIKGEELCIAYTKISSPYHERREILWSNYHFYCTCIRCASQNEHKGTTICRCRRLDSDRSTPCVQCEEDKFLSFLQEEENDIDALLDRLSNDEPDWEKKDICFQAFSRLKKLDAILSSLQSNVFLESPLDTLMRRYKIAKLDSFGNSNPNCAVLELKRIRELFLLYFPKDHEVIQSIELVISNSS